MGKKILNVFLCLSVLVQNFVLALPVKAEEFREPKIIIKGVKLGGNLLEKIDDNYLITGNGQITVEYEVENYDSKTSSFYIRTGNNLSSGTGQYRGTTKEYVNLDFLDDTTEYTISLCEDMDCNKVYSSEVINLKLAYFDEIKDSNIYITEVKQDGEVIALKDGVFEVNNKQNIEFKIKGENLKDDEEYIIKSGWNSQDVGYTGKELEDGVTFKYYTNTDYDNYFDFSWRLGCGLNKGIREYFDGENRLYANFKFIEDESKLSYEGSFVYKNYQDIKIDKTDLEYFNYYVIDSKYANINNPLMYKINGKKFEDKDYKISVVVSMDGGIDYVHEEVVNGLKLNEGYLFEVLSSNETLGLNKYIEDTSLYKFTFDIGDIHQVYEVKYNSVGKDATLSSDVYFENGKKNLSVFRGNGNYYYNSGVLDTNKDVFNKYEAIYINYKGNNFVDEEEYSYELEYGSFKETWDYTETLYEEKITSGKISGKLLNNIGLVFKVDNYKKYENPVYRLVIKKDEEIIFAEAPVINIVDSPTLANASLKANNKNLYLQMSNSSYLATRNAPLDIMISGLGFEEEKTYEFDFCYSKKISEEVGFEAGECSKVNINGKDLNEGKAKLEFKEEIDKEAIAYSFYVMCDLKTSYLENVAIQGGFDVAFVDSKELFPNLTKYHVDNVSDLIKNISKNTSVEDFTKNVSIKDNGKVKVYNKTGEEVTGNIGTGMIARVLNEYDENLLDLDVVVKGDTSGDGNISITDLVKVKRHLTEKEKLTGVYEVAGNVTDTGVIGAIDLEKISKDVAIIEEVE